MHGAKVKIASSIYDKVADNSPDFVLRTRIRIRIRKILG
jgi:hypothetical protein